MWPSGLSSDVAWSVFKLDWSLWECPGRRSGPQLSVALYPQPLGIEAIILRATAYSSIHVSGQKRLKPAFLFLSVTRISTRFSEIPKDGLKSLRFPPWIFLMGCFQVSQTPWRLECSFLAFGLFTLSYTICSLHYLNFLHNLTESLSGHTYYKTLNKRTKALQCNCNNANRLLTTRYIFGLRFLITFEMCIHKIY